MNGINEVVSNPVTPQLLISIIGALIVFIMGLLSWIFRLQISTLYKVVNGNHKDLKRAVEKNADDISVAQKEIAGLEIGELAIKIDKLEENQKEMKDDNKSDFIEMKKYVNDIFGQIRNLHDLIYDNIHQRPLKPAGQNEFDVREIIKDELTKSKIDK